MTYTDIKEKRKQLKDLISIKFFDRNDELVPAIFKLLDLKPVLNTMTPIYEVAKKLGIRVVSTNYENGGDIAQFIERSVEQNSYICVNSLTSCRKIRFNIATMIYCALHTNKDRFVVTKTPESQNFHRAKKFAANLLMPTKTLNDVIYDIDENGNFKYLVEHNGELCIPFRNIHYIAERFGVEFSQCAKRIFYSNIISIAGISSRDEFKKKLTSLDASETMRKRLIPDYAEHDYTLKCYLLNNMYFPRITRVNAEICEKLRSETVKNEVILEGVISSASKIERFLRKYRAGEVSEMYKLPISHRIIIGHYETIRDLENIPFNKYFFNELHSRLFKYAVETDEEKIWLQNPSHNRRGEGDSFIDFVPGQYRKTQNAIMTAPFETDSPAEIYNTMNNVYYDAEYLIKNKDSMTNVEYINRVNSLAHKVYVCHPFDDGNGRVVRMFMNYLFIQKNLPPVYIDASKRKKEYVQELRNVSDLCRTMLYEKIDYSKLNSIIMDCMLETESIFFPEKTMLNQPLQYIDNELKNAKSLSTNEESITENNTKK